MSAQQTTKSKQFALIGAGVVLLIVVIIYGTAKLFGDGDKSDKTPSAIAIQQGTPEKVKETTPVYRQQIHALNEERRAEREKQGQSVLPVLLPSQAEAQPRPEDLRAARAKEDADAAARATSPHNTQSDQPTMTPEQAQARTDAMRTMINGLLQRPHPGRVLVVATPPAEDTSKQAVQAVLTDRAAQPTAVPTATARAEAEQPIAVAGDTLFGVLNSQINTDEPDMVHLTITAGPLKGGTMVGTASRQNEVVKVVLTSLFFNRKAYNLTAQVMDVETARGVLSGDVDRKLMQRYGLPFLGGLVTGIGAAIAQGASQVTSSAAGTTSSTSPLSSRQIAGAALGSGAQGVSRQIQANASKTDPAVFIPAGLPVGIFLLSDAVAKAGSTTKAASSLEASIDNRDPQDRQHLTTRQQLQQKVEESAQAVQQARQTLESIPSQSTMRQNSVFTPQRFGVGIY